MWAVEALTNAKGRKDVLSRGPDELIVVIDDQFEQALPQTNGERTGCSRPESRL